MRLFLAIDIPEALGTRIHADTETLRRSCPEVAWVRPELLHFTVKFLGEVAAARSGSLQDAVGRVVWGHEKFTVRVGGTGAFPNFRRPRVVWIGVKDDRQLAALAGSVEDACVSLGFSPDARAFNAHVTLGRVKRPLDAAALQSLEREVRRAHNEYSLDVRSVDLVKSEPRPGGSHYTTMASLPLHDVT